MRRSALTKNILFFKYEEGFEIIKPSYDLILLKQQLENSKDVSNVNPKSLNFSIYASRRFMEVYFHLHKVKYCSKEQLDNVLMKYNNYTVKDALKVCNKLVKYINSYEIPIIPIKEDIRCGELKRLSIDTMQNNDIPLDIFTNIFISNNITEFTAGTITHEIVHAELISQRSIIKSFANSEVLCILIQLICCLKIDSNEILLNKEISYRKKELCTLIGALNNYFYRIELFSEETMLNCSKYLQSIIKALSLFRYYYFSNANIQNEIIKDIQSIFDGYYALEEMLDKYNITLEEGIKILSKERY